MKTHIHLYWILALFFFVACAGYTTWGLLDPSHGVVEWTGTIGLALCGVLFAFIAFYLILQNRSQGGVLVEDREDANIDDGDPELGHFSPWSWWPLMLGGSLGLIFLGIAVGFWISFFAIPLLALSLVGWVYEYYRGNFAR